MAAIFSGVSGQRAQMNLNDKAILDQNGYTNNFGHASQKMPMDEGATLVKGDYIVIPEVKDWDGRINVRTTDYTDRNGNKQVIETPFIICTVEHPEAEGIEARPDREINFFPSIFDRLCFEVHDEAGVKVRTNNPIPMRGSAVDLYKSFKYEEDGVQKGMEALAGKKIYVADAEQHDVFRFGSQTETRKQSVYELNVVEK